LADSEARAVSGGTWQIKNVKKIKRQQQNRTSERTDWRWVAGIQRYSIPDLWTA